jgi:hypothetical protein
MNEFVICTCCKKNVCAKSYYYFLMLDLLWLLIRVAVQSRHIVSFTAQTLGLSLSLSCGMGLCVCLFFVLSYVDRGLALA